MIKVSCVEDVPSGPHIAVLVYNQTQIYHEGDERSRTNPGHGYPAYTEIKESFEHYVFTGDVCEVNKELSSFLKDLEFPKYGQKKNYIVLKVEKQLKSKPTVTIEFE